MHSVVAIGVFDGVHLGHQALLEQAAAVAAEFELLPIALTFDPHPMSVIRGRKIPTLTSLPRRLQLLREYGAQQVEVCRFDQQRAAQTALQFVESKLLGELHAQHVVVGQGFRFGHGASGGVADLQSAGLVVHEIGQVTLHSQRVSSTRVREAVAAGEIELAAQMLGRPHRFQGLVVPGRKRGAALGYPTANLDPEFLQAVPADGVYAGYLLDLTESDDTARRWPAAISVGTNPTFEDVPERVVEAHALTEEPIDLYGRRMAVDFVARQRPMLAFDSVAELVCAMGEDVVRARSILGLA